MRASVFNPQFAILEVGEFALLVVVLDLVPLSSGQIRRDSDRFLSEQIPEGSVGQDFHSVAPPVEFHGQGPWLVAALSAGTYPMRSLYIGVFPSSRGAALVQCINDLVDVGSVIVSCWFPYSKKFQIAPPGIHV